MESYEELYFVWLYTKVARVDNPTPSNSYETLLGCLHRTPFQWFVVGDDNRAEDGIETRKDYFRESLHQISPSVLVEPCSVLEMLIAFSKVASFDTGMPARQWFWIFLENLRLAHCTNAEMRYNTPHAYVDQVLSIFVNREYDFDGQNGGLFPMNSPRGDMRETQLYYQFCQYLVEQGIP